ncbi:hemerythrin domain-containing protein [Nocardioides coralli]|uniref:hemerythrin domain-containing protein n=1 Tax=Nocardioides coralli TaxID=2872154 RepID=UPI001CA3DD7C|nr:hemerythrin domain-containing protein [Nocardioides coralli]QZY28954.1 hemerythrin domain-containing protein [Nocardioides coralli]
MTPAPMTQHTVTDPAWPRQVRLPGQTAAHPGPVDMTMMYVMHHAFRRDLARFAVAAEATPATDRPAWQALGRAWRQFAAALHHHHSGEDAGLWPLMEERATPEERQVLAAMEAEHAEIDPILEACAAGFERLATEPDDDARHALAVRLVAGRERLGHHLRHEETEAIAIAQRVISQTEWERVEAEHFRSGLAFREVAALVPWVMDGLPDEVRRRLLGQPGGLVLRLVGWLTGPAYERRSRVAFRHA